MKRQKLPDEVHTLVDTRPTGQNQG